MIKQNMFIVVYEENKMYIGLSFVIKQKIYLSEKKIICESENYVQIM